MLADFIGAFRSIAEGITGRKLPEPSDWAFSNWGLTPEELQKCWQMVEQTPNFWLAVFPKVSRETMQALDKAYRLYFITSRFVTEGEPIEVQTARWLMFWFGIDYPTVIVTNAKGPIAAALGLDAFIDDRAKNLTEIHEHSPYTRLFLHDLEHNRTDHSPFWTRVQSFEEFAREYVGTEVAAH